MKQCVHTLILTSLALFVTACAPIQKNNEITISTEDGVRLSALYYPEIQSQGAVMLLHDIDGSKEDWQKLIEFLGEKKIELLALDFRGHGANQQNRESWTDEDYQEILPDIKAGVHFLREKHHSRYHIGLIGAGMGANAAAVYAGNDSSMYLITILSPSENKQGFDTLSAIKKYKGPVQAYAGKDDIHSFSTLQKLQIQTNNPSYSLYATVPSDAYGISIITQHEGILPEIYQHILSNL